MLVVSLRRHADNPHSLKAMAAALLAALFAAACTAQQQPAPGSEVPVSASPAPAAASSAPTPENGHFAAAGPPRVFSDADGAPGAASLDAAGAGPAGFRPSTAFPPERVAPPSQHSAKAGDGIWIPVGDTRSEGARREAPTIVQTTIHPHPISRFLSVALVAFDLIALELEWMPGADDPRVAELPRDKAAGLVPLEAQRRLVAIMNGGWQPRHGRWGMMTHGLELVPARSEGCTVALQRDGRVSIAPWALLGSDVEQLRAYRQTPPCLLHDSTLHPELLENRERRWGGHDPKRKTRRRSAIGIDSSGSVLFFAVGVEVGPRLLAEALGHAGAVSAAELDINWNWTRLWFYEDSEAKAQPRVTSTLLPGMKPSPSEYIRHPSARDFFYLAVKRPRAPSGPDP
jgi:hypothetical protein